MLGIIAAVLVAIALNDRAATSQIAVASRTIAAGGTVDASDTRFIAVHSNEVSLLHGVMPPAALARGWVATIPIASGNPITQSEVTHPAADAGLGSMSLPVPISDADGGQIAAGDTVDVITNGGTGGAQYVAQDLRVLSVPQAASTTGVLTQTSTSDYYLVVAVDRATALRLSNALSMSTNGQNGASGISVVRTTGEAPLTSTGTS
ncbi:MAG TPA: SAF domain-containing protein [Acidimicrobiales bacterium]|nr:SAF domain-containing protein [Acidimicrobiales bacterium]